MTYIINHPSMVVLTFQVTPQVYHHSFPITFSLENNSYPIDPSSQSIFLPCAITVFPPFANHFPIISLSNPFINIIQNSPFIHPVVLLMFISHRLFYFFPPFVIGLVCGNILIGNLGVYPTKRRGFRFQFPLKPTQ